MPEQNDLLAKARASIIDQPAEATVEPVVAQPAPAELVYTGAEAMTEAQLAPPAQAVPVQEPVAAAPQPAPTVAPVQEPAPVAPVQEAPKEFDLANAVVDLNNLNIIDGASELTLSMATDNTFDRSGATTSVVCTRSAYSSMMRGLNLANKTRMLSSNDNLMDERRKFFKLVYDHIQGMNAPKPQFDIWLKMTAFSDLDTLCYGIYTQTYGTKAVDFTLNCASDSCKHETKVPVSATQIARSEDPEIGPRINGIITQISDVDGIREHTMVGKTHRRIFPDSKIVIEFTTPSLHDYLEMIDVLGRSVNLEDLVARVMFISAMYIPNVPVFRKTGVLKHIALPDKRTFFKYLGELGDADGEFFDTEINKVFEKYEVTYQIPQSTCLGCGSKIESIPLSMERMLFSRAAGKLKAS